MLHLFLKRTSPCISHMCCFQYQLIAAHLTRGNAETWFSLGQQFQDVYNMEQAINCYNRGDYDFKIFLMNVGAVAACRRVKSNES